MGSAAVAKCGAVKSKASKTVRIVCFIKVVEVFV
jgi:hypothetical protein